MNDPLDPIAMSVVETMNLSDLSAAVEKLEQAIERDGYGGLVDAARELVALHRGIPR